MTGECTNDFHISKTRGGFELRHNGAEVDVFEDAGTAADMAVRFAQDNGMGTYALFLPSRG